jgi:L-fuconolactonase
VGHLKPGKPGFASDLARLAANPRFKGVRAGGWDTPLAPAEPAFMRDLALLAERGLALDVVGGPDKLPAMARIAKALPGLRMVVDHCGGVRIDGRSMPFEWLREIYPLASHASVHMKVSGLPENTGRADHAPTDPAFYDTILHTLWNAFGEDRLIFGSNWPVCARFAPLPQILGIVRPWFEARGPAAAEKYFATNARRVYRLA